MDKKHRGVRAGRWVLWVVRGRQIGMGNGSVQHRQYFVNQSKGFDTIAHSILLRNWLLMVWTLGKKLASCLGPESGAEWSYIQLAASH